MSKEKSAGICPDAKIKALIATAGTDEARALSEAAVLLGNYPGDSRLHFLKGSLLAGQGDYGAARDAMRQAVEVSPGFVLARFQLGFLELTCGEPILAQETWGPLHSLPARHFLRLFVEGLCHLIRDEFDETIRRLEDGIAGNQENPPMNRDMQLIIDALRKGPAKNGGAASPVGLLLQQASLKSRRH
jgi:tetratricopeptide (TPR) repeat protein